MNAAIIRARKAALVLLDIWEEFNSQAMYGELLREGLGDIEYTLWEQAHEELREAFREMDQS